MFITDKIRSIMGNIDVETIPATAKSHEQIRISGIRGDLLANDLKFYYKTSRVATYLFDKIGSSYVLFPSFFALEVLEIMENIINTKRPHYVNRNTAAKVKEALLEDTWLAGTQSQAFNQRLDLTMLKVFKFQPLDFQQTWLTKFDEICDRYMLNGAILDSVMGSGKTMMGLYVSECSKVDVTIIFSPKNAMEHVWSKTIMNDLNYSPTLWRSDMPNPYRNERYILCHYEAMGNMIATVQKLRNQGKTFAIIVDESHNFNEYGTARSKNLIDLCRTSQSEYIILQSGTPFKAVGAEIVPALFCIDPTFSEDLAKRFRSLYAASATEALELLKRRLGMISYKVTKDQVGLGKPVIENFKVESPRSNEFTLEAVASRMAAFVSERTSYYNARKKDDERIYFQILEDFAKRIVTTPKERQAYNTYMGDITAIRRGDLRAAKDEIVRSNAYERDIIIPALDREEARAFKEIKTIYKYVVLKIQGETLGRILGKARMECSVEMAKCIDYDKYIQSVTKKSLVYTVYVDALKQAAETLKEKNYTPLVVYGDTNNQLKSIINEFDKNEAINPLVATFMSLSTAVPLTMASAMIMVDTPFRSHQFQQAVARIERLGQNTQTFVYIASLDTGSAPNLSTRTIDILKWSQSQIERITGTAPPFEVTEKSISVEAYAMVGKPMPDSAFIETDFEKAFMASYE